MPLETEFESSIFKFELLNLNNCIENSTLYIFRFSSQNSNSVLAIQFQLTVTDIRVVEEEQSSTDN